MVHRVPRQAAVFRAVVGEGRALQADAVQRVHAVDVAVFRGELHRHLIPRQGGVEEGRGAVVEVLREHQAAAGHREGTHFLVGLVDVPVGAEVGPVDAKVDLDVGAAATAIGELNRVVVQAVHADLTAGVLRLVPEVAHHEAGPLTAAERAVDGSDDLHLPGAVVEGFCDAVVAPAPRHFRIVVEDGVELVQLQIATDVGEPGHRDDVAVGRLHDGAFTQPFRSGVGRHEGAALRVGQHARDPRVPVVTAVH